MREKLLRKQLKRSCECDGVQSRTLVMVIVGALLCVQPSGPAAGAQPTDSFVTFDGNGSATWILRMSEPARVIVEADATLHGSSLVTLAIWVSYAQNHTKVDATWQTLYWGDTDVSVQLPQPIGKLVSGRVLGGVDGPSASWADQLDLPPGDYRVVALVAGDGGGVAGTVRLTAPAGAGVSVAQGSAFLARAYEFGSGTNIAVRSILSARFIEDASVEVLANGRLFAGFYGWSNTGIITMAVRTPSHEFTGGTEYLLTDAEPGPYRFVIVKDVDTSWPCVADGMPIPLCNLPEIWTFGADALL